MMQDRVIVTMEGE